MSITRDRYQEGSIQRVTRATGPDVWVYRWREALPDGRRVQKKRNIGDVKRLPTESSAWKAVDGFRAEINARQAALGVMTLRELWGHFAAHELRDTDVDRSHSTIVSYEKNVRAHLLPKWGEVPITEIRPVAVETWLKTLKRLPSRSGPGGQPMAPATRAKLRNQLSALFTHAIRHDLYEGANPIATVRQSGKRAKIPDILSLSEMSALLANIEQDIDRIAVLVAAVTGLRKSELRGLKWCDVDEERAVLNLKRGKVDLYESKLKTEASRKPVPIPGELVQELKKWRAISRYRADHDWILASHHRKGKEPIRLDYAMRQNIRPVAARLEIKARIGWHTFRRSYSSALISSGAGPKIVQELMRHSNVAITMDLYAQAHQDEKRAAQQSLNELFVVPKAS